MKSNRPTCRSRSKFGKCGREKGHAPDGHAVPIGDGVWFVFGRGVKPGYIKPNWGRRRELAAG